MFLVSDFETFGFYKEFFFIYKMENVWYWQVQDVFSNFDPTPKKNPKFKPSTPKNLNPHI